MDIPSENVEDAFLAGAVEHSSIQEQVATEAERETTDLKKDSIYGSIRWRSL